MTKEIHKELDDMLEVAEANEKVIESLNRETSFEVRFKGSIEIAGDWLNNTTADVKSEFIRIVKYEMTDVELRNYITSVRRVQY